MGNKKLLYLLGLVALVGAASLASTYVRVNKFTESPAVADSSVVTTLAEGEATATSTDTPKASATETAATASTPESVATGASLDANLAAVESAIDATYDDSALNAQFTNDAAASLVDSYDF